MWPLKISINMLAHCTPSLRYIRQDIIHLHTFYGPFVREQKKLLFTQQSIGIFWEYFSLLQVLLNISILFRQKRKNFTGNVKMKNIRSTWLTNTLHYRRKSFSIQMNHEIPFSLPSSLPQRITEASTVRHQRNDLIFHQGIKNDFGIRRTSTKKLK